MGNNFPKTKGNMAKKTTKKQADEVLVDIVEVRDQAQDFYVKHQKTIVGVAGGVLLVIAAFIAYKFLYLGPREKEAGEQMSQAQKQFERDSFALALTNPGGGFSGFLDVIDNYKGTKASNLANYYAGISYLNLGKFDAAISYLGDFKAKGRVLPIVKAGAMGDAYAEMNKMDKARSFYEKAVSIKANEAITPFYLKKLAMFYEKEGKTDKARKAYERIKTEFPSSSEATDIDKYLARLEGK